MRFYKSALEYERISRWVGSPQGFASENDHVVRQEATAGRQYYCPKPASLEKRTSQCVTRISLIPPCLNITTHRGTRFLEQESCRTGSDQIQARVPQAMKARILPPTGIEGYLPRGLVME